LLLPSLVSDGVTEKKSLFKFIPCWAHVVWTDCGAYQLCIKSGPTTQFIAAHLKGLKFLLAGATSLCEPTSEEPLYYRCVSYHCQLCDTVWKFRIRGVLKVFILIYHIAHATDISDNLIMLKFYLFFCLFF